MADSYERLAQFLDELPAGYPPTEGRVELRILRKLFSPAEAGLFVHLSLIGEEPRVVAYRARMPLEEVARMLEEMERKGLVAGEHRPGKAPEYSANQFVVGFWEDQVNRVDAGLAELIEAYLPLYFKLGPWTQVPQIRTIPVGVSIPLQTEVMPYERAEEIVNRHMTFAVRNCVCRQERQALGKGCDKPMETCLSFDGGAEQTVHSGKGRLISKEEALAIFKQAEESGLVLQPANSQDPAFICACCSCCCGVLRNLKRHPAPSSLVNSAFIAAPDVRLCAACGTCAERCPMEAITLGATSAVLERQRCIGCGLCASACPTGAVTLVRKPAADQPTIPKNTLSTYLKMGRSTGKLSSGKLVSLVVRSRLDRLRAGK
jgi:electron transport complex protein RnfB